MKSLTASPVVIGSQALKGFELEGLTRVAKGIPEVIPICLENLIKDIPKVFTLANEIDFDLQCFHLRTDATLDDNATFDISGNNPYSVSNLRINRVNNSQLIDNHYISVRPEYTEQFLIFNHLDTYEIKSNNDLNKIIFWCTPIHIPFGLNPPSTDKY